MIPFVAASHLLNHFQSELILPTVIPFRYPIDAALQKKVDVVGEALGNVQTRRSSKTLPYISLIATRDQNVGIRMPLVESLEPFHDSFSSRTWLRLRRSEFSY